MPVKIEPDVREVLERSRVEGSRLFLPAEQMERRLYTRVAKVLEALGGRWNRREGCHLFDRDVSSALGQGLDAGRVTSRKQDLGFFQTPAALVRRIVEMADIQAGQRVLEPSAGHGAIAEAVRSLHPDALLDCVELDPENATVLREKAFVVHEGDFLQTGGQWDRITANPPFSRGQDVQHIEHMFRCLAPGGVVVSVASAGIRYRSDRATEALRLLLDTTDSEVIDLPDGTFREAGTGVRTCIVKIHKPQERRMNQDKKREREQWLDEQILRLLERSPLTEKQLIKLAEQDLAAPEREVAPRLVVLLEAGKIQAAKRGRVVHYEMALPTSAETPENVVPLGLPLERMRSWALQRLANGPASWEELSLSLRGQFKITLAQAEEVLQGVEEDELIAPVSDEEGAPWQLAGPTPVDAPAAAPPEASSEASDANGPQTAESAPAEEPKVSLAEAFGAVAPEVVENPEALPSAAPAEPQAAPAAAAQPAAPAQDPDEPADIRRLRLDSVSQENARNLTKNASTLRSKIADGKDRIAGIKTDIKTWEKQLEKIYEELDPWAYGQLLRRDGAPPEQQPLPYAGDAPPPTQDAPPAPAASSSADPARLDIVAVPELKAISLWQPWASLIAAAGIDRAKGKTIETRDWQTNHRGWVAIHAAKQFRTEERDLCRQEPFKAALEIAGHGLDNMPRGQIVAVAQLEDVVATTAVGEISRIEAQFGDYGPDRFAWRLGTIIPVNPPIDCSGAKRLFRVDGEVLQRLQAQIREQRGKAAAEASAAAEPEPAASALESPVAPDVRLPVPPHTQDNPQPFSTETLPLPFTEPDASNGNGNGHSEPTPEQSQQLEPAEVSAN